MLKTDVTEFTPDLLEVISLFGNPDDFNVRHMFKENDGRIVNTVVLNGQCYSFGNLVGTFKDDIERKRILKRYAKLSVYKAFSKNLNKDLPWGALTGIRPTKLAYSELNEGRDFEDFFINTLKVSPEKAKLTREVIDGQKGIYKRAEGLTDFFVFIPFCPSKCKYCSFITSDISVSGKYENEYVDTLIKEIEYSKKYVKKLRSIYIGGGTPFAVSPENLDRILTSLDDINVGVEFTVEAGRPDCITDEKIDILIKHRVTRICINPQTFIDKTLESIGRKHTVEQVIEKYNKYKDKFIINMDFIAGLENETLSDFFYSIDKAVELSPDNITVHTLCLKKGSTLKEKVGSIESTDVAGMVDYAYKKLTENGYFPYYLYRQKYQADNLENVGYSKPNAQCVYNIDVMEEISDNIACGANGISKRIYNLGERIERYASPKDIKTYLEKIDTILVEKDKLFN